MEVVIVVVAIIVGLFVYFIPTIVAGGKQSTQVFVVNSFWLVIDRLGHRFGLGTSIG